MKYLILALTLIVTSCAKTNTSFICGDHKCINRAEAKQYFEENLTLEVSINTKDKESRFDLVGINLGQENQKIKVFQKENKKVVRKLSKKEIKDKKKALKKRKKDKVIKAEKVKKIDNNDIKKISRNDLRKNPIDICLKLVKCDIDSISNYLIKLSNEKDYPNISLRE